MKKKRRIPIFYIVFILLLIIACITLNIGLNALESYLSDYESSQPVYLAEEIFNKYYKSCDFETLITLSDNTISEFESTDTLAKYLHEKYDGKKITYHSSVVDKNDVLKYTVKSENNTISEFTLKKGDKTTENGFNLYEQNTFKLYYAADESVKVNIPSNYTLYLNEHKVSKENLIEPNIKTDSCKHMPKGVDGITYSPYKIEGLLINPEVTAKNSDGEISNLVYDKEQDMFKSEIIFDGNLKNEFGAKIIEATEHYAMYMESDASWRKIKGYFDPESTLYTSIHTSENYFVMPHTDYRFEDESTGEFYAYDENTFSCRVSFTHVLTKKRKEDFKDKIDMTLYLRKVNGKYLIYDRYNNN